jgi:hypothetical protein
MRLTSLRGFALALSLMGCASVPTLRGAPEDIGDQIGSNAVAYNQGYGRAIGDQVLLNILRARDRLPLYHLSMSGIADHSQLQQTDQLQIGSVGLGDGNGGVGQLTGGQTLTISPQYTLDPFGSDAAHRARQFEPAAREAFQHYWNNNWPVEVLLYVMAQEIIVQRPGQTRRRNRAPSFTAVGTNVNRSGGYRGDCAGRPGYTPTPIQAPPARANLLAHETAEQRQERETREAREARCGFIWTVQRIADAPQRPTLETTLCAQEPAVGDAPPPPRRICTITIRSEQDVQRYVVHLRSLDDMLYFLGSILREVDQAQEQPEVDAPAGVIQTRLSVRPSNIAPEDHEHWNDIPRSSPLFAIRPAPRHYEHGDYAAEVRYRGVRYVAGPVDGVVCIGVAHCSDWEPRRLDSSSRVLSLLTQLVIISQSGEAQLAPRNVIASD